MLVPTVKVVVNVPTPFNGGVEVTDKRGNLLFRKTIAGAGTYSEEVKTDTFSLTVYVYMTAR
jgi:hypothetical protein